MKRSEIKDIIQESMNELLQEGFLDSLGTVMSPKGSFQQIAHKKVKSKRAQKIYNQFRDRIVNSYVIAYKINESILTNIYKNSSSARNKASNSGDFINRFNSATGNVYSGRDIESLNKSKQNEYVDKLLKFVNLKVSYDNIM